MRGFAATALSRIKAPGAFDRSLRLACACGLILVGQARWEIETRAQELPAGARVLAEGFLFAEGPAVAPDGSLYFTDVRGNRIHRRNGSSVETFYEGPEGCNGLAFDREGYLYACAGAAGAILRFTAEGAATRWIDQVDGQPLNRPNDLAFDARGNLFFTNPAGLGGAEPRSPVGVVRVRPDRSAAVVATGPAYPNGIGVSPDGRYLYVNDTQGGSVVYRFPLSDDGEVGAGEVWVRLGAGGPDGMTLAASGVVYVALNLGAKIVKLSPEGRTLGEIIFPRGSGVTNLCFGGEDWRTLYVTLATRRQLIALPADEPGFPLPPRR